MNKIFKTVWNSVRRCLVVVNEATKSASQRGSCSGSVTDETAKSVSVIGKVKHPEIFLACLALCWSAGANAVTGEIGYDLGYGGSRLGYTITFDSGLTNLNVNQHWVVKARTVFQVNAGATVVAKGINMKTYCKHNCRTTMSLNGTFILDDNSSWTSAGGSSHAFYVNNGGRFVLNGNFAVDPGIHVGSGGTVETKAKNFFSNVQSKSVLNAYAMNVINARGAKTTVSSDSYGYRNLIQTVGGKTKWISNGGTFIVNDIAEGTDAANAIRAAIGGNVKFTGKNDSGAVGDFNVALMNILTREGKSDLIFYDRDLKSEANLTFGSGSTSSTKIAANYGFRSLANAKNITVADNKTLTLIGNGSKTYNMTATNSKISVDNASLNLGHTALSSNGGHLYAVDLTKNGNLSIAKGTYTIDSVSGGKSINNAGTLDISDLNQAVGVAYTQTDGTITTKNGWFDKSTLNLNGGSLNRNALGANTVNINGANVVTGTLDSFTKLSMNKGSLVADKLNLTSDGITYKQNGGTLTTKQDSLFENVNFSVQDGLNTISLNGDVPEDVKTSLSDFFQKYVPGNLKQQIMDHASFTGGKVVISGVNLTTTMRDDLTKAFIDHFGTSTQIVFEGTIAGVSQNDILNTAKVNELADNSVLKDVIFVDRALQGEGQSVTIGNAGVKNSTGFMSIANSRDVTISDGKNLVLIGAKSNDFQLADSAVSVKGQGSKLTLGAKTLRDAQSYQGVLKEVILSGGANLSFLTGSYTVDNLRSNASSVVVDSVANVADLEARKGNVTVNKTGTLNGGSVILNSGAELANYGKATFSGVLEGTGEASVVNKENATLTVKGNSSLIGTFDNAGHAILADFSTNGTFTNQDSGYVEVNKLSVLGKLNNFGKLDASDTSTVYGQLTNTGVIRLFDTEVGNRGAINNTHTITATGTVTLNGLISSVGDADFEELVLAGKDAILENNNGGSLVIENMTLSDGAYAINGGAGTFSPFTYSLYRGPATEIVRILNVGAGSQKTNASIGFYGQGTIDGTFTNAESGQSTFGISSEIIDGQGIAISKTGKLQNAGTVTFGGSLANAGSITGDGKVIFKREAAGSNVFTNSGTIKVGQLQANNITYEHTDGSIESANGWFTNSIVNVKGGTMAHGELGQGNVYTVGLVGNKNQVATLNIDRVTSDSEVHIIDGGNFIAPTIELTQDKKTIHLSGGTLSTTLNQLFSDVYYKTLDIDAQNPDDQVDIEGVKVATGVSGVLDSIQKGIEFGWGTVAFDDAVYSASMATDVLNKLDAVDVDPEGHEGQLEVAFNGKAAQSFNIDLANAVIAKKEGVLTYATFANEILTNESVAHPTAHTKLFVGAKDSHSAMAQTDANILDNSIGFKGVQGATGGIFVDRDHHLVLVGEDGTMAEAEKFQLADGAVWVGGTNALVTLGSYGTANKTKGHLETAYVGVSPVDVNGAMGNGMLRVRHGDFTIGTLTNGGQIFIGGDGNNGLRKDSDVSLSVAKYVANGNPGVLTNFGTFHADSIEMGEGTGQAKIVNENVMTADNVNFNGTLANNKTFTGKNVTLVYGAAHDTHELTSKESVNAKGATWAADTMTVAGNSKWGSGADARGGFLNEGTLNINTSLIVDGTMVNKGTATIAQATVTGDMTNDANAQATVDQLNFTAGKFANAGILDAKQASIESELVNDGEYKTAGTTINTNGQLTNNGTINATGKVSVAGGKLINNKTANLNGLDITAGQVIVAAGSTFKDEGKTTVNMANKTDVAIDNKTDLELADLDLVKGTIAGGTLHVTNANVGTDGVIDQVVGFFESLVNSGTVNVISGTVNGLDNQASGQLASAGDLNIAGNSAGSVTVDGLMTVENGKTFTSTGTVLANGSTQVDGTFNAHGTTNLKGDTIIAETGKLSANGTFNASNINIANGGSFTSAGQSEVGKIVAQAGSNLNVDGGTLHVGDLNASNMTYTQTAGSISSDKGWFTNSVLNIAGGKLDATQIKDANGVVTGDLGHNTVNISGKNPMPSINNEDTVENKSHWKDNLTVVTANKVTSDTTININAGGVLDVEDIELSAPNSITVAGGGLQTSLGEIFDWVKTEVIKIDAEDPDSGTIELPTQVLVSTSVGDVQQSIKDGIRFESGMIAFDDDHFSASTVVSAGIKFGNAFADSKVTMHFLGSMAEKFTIDTADRLIAEGLPEVLHGIVLDTTTLHNTSAAAGDTNKNLVIGGTADGANSIGINMGFQNVANADNVTIEGDKEFALVGYQRPEGFDWTTGYDDSNKLLVDATDGGSVTVNNGIFTMGSDGVRNPTIGWVNSTDIGANGTLVVKNGEFADWEITNAGTINVNKNGILHTNTLTNNKDVNVAGALTIDQLDNANGTITNIGSILLTGTQDINGTINNGGTFEAQGQVTVSGNYTSDKNGKNIFEDLTVGGVMGNAGDLLIKGEEGVTDDEFKLTIAQGGKLTNAGTLTNTSHDTKVEGTLINGGTANYDDMTIVAGGVSNNAGYEKGDILTIDEGGKHVNTGTSIWNNMQLSGNATNEEKGKSFFEGVLDIIAGGSMTNKGELDATKTPTTNVAGTMTNDKTGKAEYDDMTIASGGISNNAGYEKGDILTVDKGGKHVNTGTSIWNNTQIAGSAENSEGGKTSIEGTFDINGDYTNKGELDATKTPTTNVAGTLTNDKTGKAEYDDMKVATGGSSINNGYEKGDILDVTGKWENNGESHWNNIVINQGGQTSFGTDSKTEADKVTVNGGTLHANGGDITANKTELNKGTFVVGNHLAAEEANKVDFVVKDPGTINTNSWVIGNGNLILGTNKTFDDDIGMPTLPKHPSRVTVGSTVTIGEQGSLAVGTQTWTDEGTHIDVANGDLYFASDSTTIIDATTLGQKDPAFQGSLEGAKVTVEDGATLILGNVSAVGDYTITNGFLTAGNTENGIWTGGWTEDNLYALPQNGSGLEWILTLHNNANKVWVNAKLEDVQNKYPDIAIPDNSNDSLLHPNNKPDNSFINGTLMDKNHGVSDKTKVINSVAEIGFAGGVASLAMNDLTSATNSIENRVSMMSEVFNSDGTMTREFGKGNGLWVDVLHSEQEADSYKATGNLSTGFDASSTGFVVGFDRLMRQDQMIVGGAISYQTGDSDSTGNVVATKNDNTTFGLHGYMAYSPSPKLNVMGSISYLRNSAELSQNLPFGGFGKAEADVDTNMITAGVRAERTLKVTDAVKIVPHAGLRLIHSDSGSYDTELDGKKAFDNDTDAATLVQFPIGVAVRMDKQMDNGWNVRPQADLTMIPQAGDTSQSIKVTGTSGVSDKVEGDFTGKFNTQMSMGVQAQKGKTTFGARYGMNVGGDGKQDHTFKVEARFHF